MKLSTIQFLISIKNQKLIELFRDNKNETDYFIPLNEEDFLKIFESEKYVQIIDSKKKYIDKFKIINYITWKWQIIFRISIKIKNRYLYYN